MKELSFIHHILERQLSKKRYEHSLGVQQSAIKLAKIYDEDEKKASIAGLIHDCAKDFSNEMLLKYIRQFDIILDDVTKNHIGLLHGEVGASYARNEFGIEDEEILNAVKFHTTGRVNMTLLEKIVYLADYIEPNRSFNGVNEIRELALSDLDKATLLAFDYTIKYEITKQGLLHPNTIHARNFLLLENKRFGRE